MPSLPSSARGLPPAAPVASDGAAGLATNAASNAVEDLEEGLRATLAAWQELRSARSAADVDAVVGELAHDACLSPDLVKIMWHSVARSVRPVGGSTEMYVTLAQQHYGLEAEVVDLGQYSAERSNSCMFLTCAASIVFRHQRSIDGADLPRVVREIWGVEEAGIKAASMDSLLEEHRAERAGVLGRLADALRQLACDALQLGQELYMPFFAPVGRGARYFVGDPSADDYRRWVARLRGEEEGDELVMLALAKICGFAVQAVQRSGYRVPLMDPLDAASGFTAYWGNDDKHWVWLRPCER